MGPNIPLLNSKDKNLLNIYLLGEDADFIEKINNKNSYFNKKDKFNWKIEFLNKGITEDNINLINNDIISKLQVKDECNCILIFLGEGKFEEIKTIILNYLKKTKKIYKPSIILAVDESKQIYVKNNSSDKNFDIAYYTKKNYLDIENKINSLYNYFYNIDDCLTNFNSILDEFFEDNENFESKKLESKFKATFNILVIGRPGCGKSTLINLILNEKRAREGIGFSITKLISQYAHKKYPITLTDTPGFENDKDLNKMKKFLCNYNTFFDIGRNKFHLILYLINTMNERTFTGLETDLIKYIYTNLKIPIFFICTRARTEEISQNFKEEVKINLIQRFGLSTKLCEYIYCCNLLNEKDGIYKRFGLDKLLIGIKDYFSKDITKINFIKSEFKNSINMINTNTYADYELNILSSLEYSSSFKIYLTNLLRKIIEKYKTLISKINQNIPNLDEKLKKIYETLKKHLAFELNKDESEINDSLYEKCFATCGDFFSGNTENNIKKKYLDKINNIENFLVNDLNNKIKNFDSFMEEIINNYEKSINSFLNINDDINKNEIY